MFNLILTTDFSLENQGEKSKYITKLENTLIKYNSDLLNGLTYVEDTTYINCIELLSLLCSDSPLLENEKNVIFIKDINEDTINNLEDKLKDSELKFYLNPQGMNVKLYYEFGELKSATTYGRSFKNQNILSIMKALSLDRNDMLSDYANIEILGVLVLPFENISMATEFCSVWDAYQGVFSVLQYEIEEKKELESSDEDIEFDNILHFIATDMILLDFQDMSVDDKYEFLEDKGFIVPNLYEKERTENLVFDVEDILSQAEIEKCDFEYLTDGVRILTNSNDIILLKVGSWKITTFEGIVKWIRWDEKKGKKIPVLELEESIFVTDELMVSEIPLNAINLLLILNIEIGEIIRFAYFGDMGLLPITEKNEIILN